MKAWTQYIEWGELEFFFGFIMVSVSAFKERNGTWCAEERGWNVKAHLLVLACAPAVTILKGAWKTVFWQTEEHASLVPHNERVQGHTRQTFLLSETLYERIVIINKISFMYSSKVCQLELLTSEHSDLCVLPLHSHYSTASVMLQWWGWCWELLFDLRHLLLSS